MPTPHPFITSSTPNAKPSPLRAQLAWSAYREKRLQRMADALTLAVICGNIVGLGWLSAAREAQLLIISGGALLFALHKIREKSRAMLSNKPAASNYAAEGTKWIQHPSDSLMFDKFICECGKGHIWANAEQFPKPPQKMARGTVSGDLAGYPAGQARLSLVCACGRGHYRLIT